MKVIFEDSFTKAHTKNDHEAKDLLAKKSKLDKDLLEKAKALRIGRLALDFENMSNVIRIAASDVTFLGSPRGYEQIKSEIEKVKIDEIEKSVNKYLSKENISKSMLVPQKFEE